MAYCIVHYHLRSKGTLGKPMLHRHVTLEEAEKHGKTCRELTFRCFVGSDCLEPQKATFG